MIRLIFIVQTVLTLWMLVDAAKRDRFYPWFIIILIPFGELAYLFAVKIPEDLARARRQPVTARRRSCRR